VNIKSDFWNIRSRGTAAGLTLSNRDEVKKWVGLSAPLIAEMEADGLLTDEPTVSNNDQSECEDVYSAEREAGGGSDSSGHNSDCSTAHGQIKESDTPDT